MSNKTKGWPTSVMVTYAIVDFNVMLNIFIDKYCYFLLVFFCYLIVMAGLLIVVMVITKLSNSEQSSKSKVKTHKYINRQISQQPENCENRNDPDLVQAFLKKW